MEPNNNPFSNRDEVWFVDYDGILEDSNQFMLYKVFNDLYDHYSTFLDIEKYKGSSMETCLTYASLLTERNFMFALSKKEFDYEQAYIELYDYYEDMYEQCEKLLFNLAITKTINKPFCKKIYIYSRFKDIRIEKDIIDRFGNDKKLVYCYGNIEEIINEIPDKLTSFFITQYDTLYDISRYKKLDYSEILLADYMYNRFIDGATGEAISHLNNVDNIFGDSIVKVKSFTPVLLDPRHYEDIKRSE